MDRVTLIAHPKKYGIYILKIRRGEERLPEKEIELSETDILDVGDCINGYL